MYFTLFMLGVLYAIFTLFLIAAGTPLVLVAPIVGVMVVVLSLIHI